MIPAQAAAGFFSTALMRELAKDKKNEGYKEALEEQLATCHSSDLYDTSLISDGDRVVHRLTGRRGVVTVEEMQGYGAIIRITYEDDGSVGYVYANQIKRVL